MRQLKMCWRPPIMICSPLPDGFHFELYSGTPEEIEDWLNICAEGILPDNAPSWFNDVMVNYPDINLRRDLLFIVNSQGERIGTVTVVKRRNGEGNIHMVCILPAYRGKGLSKSALMLAVCALQGRGCSRITLTTDDFRIPAIKTYLWAGFLPVLTDDPESDMRARWDKVLATIGHEPVEYLTETEEDI